MFGVEWGKVLEMVEYCLKCLKKDVIRKPYS